MLTLHAPESTGIHFSNTLYPSTELNVITFEYFYNGAGVAIGDINKDGLQDLYFSGNMVPGRLYVNKGNFSFEDVTKASGIDTTGKWGTGVAMVDINADGFLDLYLCFSGPYGPEQRKNQLYINNGNSTFTEMAEKYGLDDDSHTTQAAFLDYDLDGDLDLYLLNNMTDRTGPNVIRPKRNNGEMINTDKLYRNDGNRFTDVSEEAGIRKEGYGLGIAIGDIDQDGYPDIYVSNDYLSNDLLYLNNGNGTFTDRAEEFLKHTSYSSMGCDMADYNNDGLLDIVALDMLPPDQRRRMEMIGSINHKRFQSELDNGYAPQFMRNSLQLNRGKLSGGQLPFSEIGQYAGIESTDWSWSPILADMDNDGLKDLLVTNGYPKDITNLDFASYKANSIMKGFFNNAVLADLVKEMEKTTGAYLPNFGYKNLGNLAFGNVSREWGFTQNSFSHGAAIADLDNDGDLDYVVNNSYDSIFIYENTLPKTAQHNYLRLKFKGASLNPEGWGTKIWMYQDTLVQYQEYYPVRGYQSTMEPFVHFGLGGRKVDSVVVEWSDRVTHILHEPDSDQVLTLGYPTSDTDVYKESKTRTPTLFEEVALVDFKHAETYFSDFEQLPLLLQGYAQSGPGLCVWDVNGDGHDDFYIGGARGQAGALFKGLGDGRFKRLPLDLDTESEDLDAVFFDADNDGDKDLYVCSGSTEFPSGSDYYTDRLYTNNGKGVFEDASDKLPALVINSTVVAPADFDNDGDMDLFIGGGVQPESYGVQRSYLLENKNGTFVDVTETWGPGIAEIGAVTSAKWVDVDHNGKMDLWICGEWLPITLFHNTGKTLENGTKVSGLESTVGLWNTMIVIDLDHDGDKDLVAGNLGKNTPYRTHPKEPFSRLAGDFDGDGIVEFPIAHYLQGKQVPMHFRDDLLGRMQSLKKTFPDYHSYATASWSEVLPRISEGEETVINTFASCWLENKGDGRFAVHELPKEAQLAPVHAILAHDINADGTTDLLLTGNSKVYSPFAGYLDALQGLVLLRNAGGGFRAVDSRTSGFHVPGEGRAIALLNPLDSIPLVLAVQNNGPLKIFKLNNGSGMNQKE